MRYFAKGLDRAVAESDRTAAALLSAGWRECTRETHRALWRIADAAAFARLWRELDERAVLGMSTDGGAYFPGPAVERVVGWPKVLP